MRRIALILALLAACDDEPNLPSEPAARQNRLSDVLWLMARWVETKAGVG